MAEQLYNLDRGQQYNNWTIIGDAFSQRSKNSTTVYIPCRCICGKEKNVVKFALLRGRSKSCGCAEGRATRKRPIKNLLGKRFGRLFVAAFAETHPTRHSPLWWCVCDCGEVCKKCGADLVHQKTFSCGCAHKENLTKSNGHDLTGMRFGRLSVLRRDETKRGISMRIWWRCVCDCGQEVSVRGRSLELGDTRSCGCYHRECIKKANSGANNWNWKGGITPLSARIRNLGKHTQLVQQCFERDNFICQYSGVKVDSPHAHHIKPFSKIIHENNISDMSDALMCAELWDLDNLVTLSQEYHSITSSNPRAFHRQYSTYASEADFWEWFETRPLEMHELEKGGIENVNL